MVLDFFDRSVYCWSFENCRFSQAILYLPQNLGLANGMQTPWHINVILYVDCSYVSYSVLMELIFCCAGVSFSLADLNRALSTCLACL